MASAVQLAQLLALQPAVEGRPGGRAVPTRGVVWTDDVQMDRRVSELVKSGERNAEALARPCVGHEEQLERPRAEIVGCRGVERGVERRRVDRHHARHMLEHGGRPREHPVGRFDESPRVRKPGFGGDETAAWIQTGVGADALMPQHARQVEPLDRLGLAGAVLPEAENPSHEPKEDAIDVGDAERGREPWELCERQNRRRERVAHLVHREEHGVGAGLMQRERVGVTEAASPPWEVRVDVGQPRAPHPHAQIARDQARAAFATARPPKRRPRGGGVDDRDVILRDEVSVAHRGAGGM